jgi:predicted Fe-Mo cluster-binding NifX family protein
MKIAVASQNRKTITGHAGRCRKFWIYEVKGREVKDKSLMELPIGQSLHESHDQPHPLDDMHALITGGMGQGLVRRLSSMGIEGLVTSETDPDKAIADYLLGRLITLSPKDHDERNTHAHHH